MLTVSELYIYPIKSLGGVFLNEAKLTDRGLEYDRRWMLIDKNNRFLTQREFPEMSLLQVQLANNGLLVNHKKYNEETLFIPYQTEKEEKLIVEVWEDKCEAQPVSNKADKWFSDMLSIDCRLVFMPESTQRKVDIRYAANKEITSFSDGYPLLLIGQSSLNDLNNRLTEPLPMNRFRPNVVFTGGEPYEEDTLEHFIINGISFFGVKLCSRCVITTTNQDDASRSREPLKTLASYRAKDSNVYFGQNLLYNGEGVIHLNDTIEIVTQKRNLLEIS